MATVGVKGLMASARQPQHFFKLVKNS